MGLLEYGLLFVVGIVIGVINTLSGGGSLLSLPVLITFGLPADVANATNRIGVLTGSFSASFGFKSKNIYPKKAILFLIAPCIVGTIIGVNLSLQLDEQLFKRIISIVLLVSLVYLFLKKKVSVAVEDVFEQNKRSSILLCMVAFFLIGIYGGFLQAGAGFMVITVLVGVGGQTLVKANATKSTLIGLYTCVALFLFWLEGKVEWVPGLFLASGSLVSSWFTGRLSTRLTDRHIKPFLIVMVVAFIIKLWVD